MKASIEKKFRLAMEMLGRLNTPIEARQGDEGGARPHRLQKVLVANRGEIAKRFFLALHEEGIPSAAIVTDPDRGQSWYEFADEVVYIGEHYNYASIGTVIAAAVLIGANAVYSGYGFLSENAEFVEAMETVSGITGRELIFMGPGHRTIRLVGDKLSARKLAREHDIPLFDSSGILAPGMMRQAKDEAARIGYPVMVKLVSGGGGKGMYPVRAEKDLKWAVDSCARIGRELYGNDGFYIEKFIERPVHIEVQIFNGWAIGVRKCAVQRRNQKIIEESGHSFLDDYVSLSLLSVAEKIAQVSGYGDGGGAGTVEFLFDGKTGRFGFMEMNTRLQVEYAVTDQSLGVDIAKWQILHFDGREKEIMGLDVLKHRIAEKDHSIECRIYAEEPENDYLPSPGHIREMDLPTFNGIRCDLGFGEGDTILPMYDPLIGKIIAHGATRKDAMIRLERALQELYIKGIKTNINQLLRIVRHPAFERGDYTNNILAEYPELSFREDDKKAPAAGDGLTHIAFGAFAEYLRHLQRSVRDFIIVAGIEGYIDAPLMPGVPCRHCVEYGGAEHRMEFLQVSLDSFYAFADGEFLGTIVLVSLNDRCDDVLVIYGNRSYRIRVNRHGHLMDLKMKDESNKIDYFRLKVSAGADGAEDSALSVVSPFQGSFVSLCGKLKPGDTVRKGDPLMVLSSMKMETVINAPESGELLSLIEDGDPARLVIARPEGRVIGRSIQEGELLAVIKKSSAPGGKREKSAVVARGRARARRKTDSDFDLIMDDGFEGAAVKNPEKYLHRSLSLLFAASQGFIQKPAFADMLVRVFKKLPSDDPSKKLTGDDLELLNRIVRHYACVKKAFSPVLSEIGLSYQEELDLHVENLRAADRRLPSASSSFREMMEMLLNLYGLTQWSGRAEVKRMLSQYVYYLLKLSYQFCLDHTDIIQKAVQLLSHVKDPGDEVMRTVWMLFEQEQAERDDSLLKFIRKTFSHRLADAGEIVRLRAAGIVPKLAGQFLDFREAQQERLRELCGAAEAVQELPDYFPAWFAEKIRARLVLLANNYRVERLVSPVMNVAVYRLVPAAEDRRATLIAYACAYHASKSDRYVDFSSALGDARWAVELHRDSAPGDTYWIEAVTEGVVLLCGSGCGADDTCVTLDEFREACASAVRGARGYSIRGLIHVRTRYPFREDTGEEEILFYASGDSVSLEHAVESDRNSLYQSAGKPNILNQRLFNVHKWPTEIWASRCLDPGSMRELQIRLVDYDRESGSETKTTVRPVGSRIYHGTIGGKDALFYMKDSRISGGSTGSKEGLKYVAAAYLAYLKDWPLYVWNDSAGANIMEGVVSLNRGAEGFMMNALLTDRAGSDRFTRYIRDTADPALKNLFAALDEDYGLSVAGLDRKHRRFQLVAVGIGPSAGLDVYGSSQASIQVLLDSEQSYRVLTGSSVIRTVIGEDISNYDIGGAKILGKWTGIVDIIAPDKLHLVSLISQIHACFGADSQLDRIRRTGRVRAAAGGNEVIIFDEAVIRENTDDGFFISFKEDYYASHGLIGGFARIGGRRVLVMGPRTDRGLRSEASIIKAKELMRAAHRTASHQLIVFGRKWLEKPDYHESVSMRPAMDLRDAMHKKSGVRIHIVTDVEGLHAGDINSTADAVIYVRSAGDHHGAMAFAAKNAAFIVPLLKDAFDLALSLLNILDPVMQQPEERRKAGGVPGIPVSTATPYAIIDSVIVPVFDRGSFIEFFRDMNNPVTGPHLVTGLARLDGVTVGVIADQPLQKGGGADAAGTEKFRVFTEFLNRNSIPLVMLSNSSGFVPGSMQERQRIQAIGAESLDANILGRIPVVSVTLNQNYGGRLIHAYNKFLRPGIVYLALEQAVLAVIGVEAAFDLLYGAKHQRLLDEGKKKEAAVLKNEFTRSYLDKAKAGNDALRTGLVDWIIPDIRGLREHLIKGLELAMRRCRDAFGADGCGGEKNPGR